MRLRPEIQDALIAIGLPMLILAVVAGGPFLLRPRHQSPLPLAASPYLRQIVEPVTLEFAISLDDGGSKDVAFRDAAGRRISLSLVCFDLREWGSNKPHQLAFNVDGHERFVPVRGPDERALLGLLQRWSRSAGVGDELLDRYRKLTRHEIDTPAFEAGRGDLAYFEVVALSVLRQLSAR